VCPGQTSLAANRTHLNQTSSRLHTHTLESNKCLIKQATDHTHLNQTNAFFLEHAEELRIIILRRNGLEPVQPPPKYKLNFKLHQQPLETKKETTYQSKLLFSLEPGHQKGNPFCPNQLPNSPFLLSLTQRSCQTRRSTIRHTLIAMFS
jgi:hypothetical protein